MLFEDWIESMLERRVRGAFLLSGPPGSGRRTAIRSMRARFASTCDRVEFVPGVEEDWLGLVEDGERLCIGIAWHGTVGVRAASILEMEPWSRDECIEYLLAAHPDQVASILSRLAAAYHVIDPRGHVGTMRATMDAMARDASVFGVDEAIERLLASGASECGRWPPVRTYQVARELVRSLAGRTGTGELLKLEFPDEFHAASMLLRRSPHAMQTLFECVDNEERSLAARARFFVNRIDVRAIGEWLERRFAATGGLPDLAQHSLSGVDLNGRSLIALTAQQARLSLANLTDANLRKARLDGADLSNACLRRAYLGSTRLREANLRGADLTAVSAFSAQLRGADLSGANLNKSRCCWANMVLARLDGATLVDVDMTHANLTRVSLVGAVLRDVVFEDAELDSVDFTVAELHAHRFARASLQGANLQGLHLPQVDFSNANLSRALLTSSWMPGADFRDANLMSAGLGDVNWPRADLSRANLRGASFHFGSSRSGLVFHGPPMEGTRTGFYTDEFLQLIHQPPEKVRRANLVGANLLGANITGVDFYLVDLRGARYYEQQRQHFRRCGAILDDWPGPR